MMEINRQNYEAYLLDLLEGRLDEETTRRLKEFLLHHPEYSGVPDHETWVRLEPEPLGFSGRERLKKEFPGPESVLTGENFDMFSIARMEGDLTPEQEEDHRTMVDSGQNWKEEWEHWQKARLGSESIAYNGKRDLKKREARPKLVLWTGMAAAAAAIALVFILIRTGIPGPDPATGLSGISPRESTGIMESKPEITGSPEEEQTSGIADTPAGEADRLAEAGKPVSLSIRKHQDPPELTGQGQPVSPEKDTLHAVPAEATLLNPVDPTLSAVRIAAISETGTYDRIIPLPLPPVKVHEAELSISAISEKGLMQASQDYLRDKDITLLGIASAGFQGFSRLTGSDLTFGITRDENGKISVIRFRSDLLSVDAPLKKSR